MRPQSNKNKSITFAISQTSSVIKNIHREGAISNWCWSLFFSWGKRFYSISNLNF
jgi:hypothetical protein